MTSHNSSTTPQQMEALLAAHAETIRTQNLTRPAVMRLTGLGESAARRLIALSHGLKPGRRVPGHGHGRAPASPDADTLIMDQQGDTLKVEAPATHLPDPETLLRRAGVDLTVWEIERAIMKEWTMGSMPRRTGNDKDGWARPSTAAQVTPLHSVTVYLKRRKDTLDIVQFKQDALAEIRAAAQPLNAAAPRPKRRKAGTGQLLYLGAHDVHVGKLALSAETLQHYDSREASRLALGCLDQLLTEAAPHGVAQIVLPVGHDLAHFESGSYGTSSGTPQDPDGRYRLMRRLAYELMVDMVQRAAQVAPVTVIGVPGNHGRDTDLGIAERLEARFHGHAHVQVQAPLTPRSYFEFGKTLLGLTHGDRIKPDKLPLVMADEMCEAWARTTHREWMLGHLHAKQTYQVMQSECEHRGVRVRILPSISATDYWHAVSGYSNARAMEAYRYADWGYSGHHSVPVERV